MHWELPNAPLLVAKCDTSATLSDMEAEKTQEAAQGEMPPEQRYSLICAQIGERQYLAARLNAEIALLMKKLDELHQKSQEPPK